MFLPVAEPRRTGTENYQPFYQPVAGKAFIQVCGNYYDAKSFPVKVVPILPAKDFPLSEQNTERYGEACKKVSSYFK